MEMKAIEAVDRLLDELGKGKVSELEAAYQNEAIAIIYRVGIAARDGTARRNLRLLAQAVAGLTARDRLFSDEFNKYADILSRLTRDQIFVVGRLIAAYALEENSADGGDSEKIRAAAFGRLREELVPAQFPTKEHLTTIYSQFTGFGLLTAASAFGGLAYRPSPLLHEVSDLVDFEGALKTEGDIA